MIDRAAVARLPARPESEFEWEDLLVRLELMPRALRVELEATPAHAVRTLLASLVSRESAVRDYLEGVVSARPELSFPREQSGAHSCAAPASVVPASAPEEMVDGQNRALDAPLAASPVSDEPLHELDGPELLDHFIRLRRRNFAMLQRRGIEVWNWVIEIGDGTSLTVFQLLTLLVGADVEVLARMRGTRPAGLQTC